MLKKLFLSVIIALSVIFFVPSQSLASSNFTTDYHVIYTASENGITHAILDVTLTNTTSQYYASSYKIQVGFDKITNVLASDSKGPMTPVVAKADDGYVIELPFNQKTVGLGSKLQFNLSFDTPTVAKRYGKIWEINIPGLSDPNDFNSFLVEVQTPAAFGNPVYIKPDQVSKKLTFTKEQLGKSGISIAFGEKQIYGFHLDYHIKNTNVFHIKTEIALPPTTNYQDVFITSIEPKPNNVTLDKDGNWLAQYTLLPSQQMDVTVDGKAQIKLTPSVQELSQKDFTDYLSEKQYWEAKSDVIRELADELKTPEAIYNYVVKTLKYDFSRVTDDKPRLGAAASLKNQNSAVCLEFTDLFIALARAAGIPAREVDGFAYTENEKQRPLSLVRDILHAWPEYYDSNKKTWIMVDPTWGSTTGGVDYFSVLDFDHFAFVIKGMDSNYPIPAGGYKLPEEKDMKDVDVSFADSVPDNTVDMKIASSLPNTVIAGFPIQGDVTLTNNGSGFIPPQLLYLSAISLLPKEQVISASGIPPFGFETIPVSFDRTSFLTNTSSGFTIHMTGDNFSQNIKIAPIFLTVWGIGGILIGLFALFIFIVTGKSRRL